jgi:hypothetical protein
MLSPDSNRMTDMSRRGLPGKREALAVKFVGLNGGTGLRLALGIPFLASSVLLAGCMSDPTYGTGKSQGIQLAEDLTGMLSLAPKQRETLAYEPRPELVRPAPDAEPVLPAPQQKLATTENPDWVESPEQKRARLKKEITANRDDPDYESPIEGAVASADTGRSQVSADIGSPRAHDAGRRYGDNASNDRTRAAFKEKLAEQKQGSPTTRRYLSDPPLDYRAPAQTAAVDDVGEDELKKERRRKAEAKKAAGGGRSWRDLVPGL